jgi:tetratricopeptide (TPR) repeat protein
MKKWLFLFLLGLFGANIFSQTKWDYPVKPGSDKWKDFITHEEMVDACKIPDAVIEKMSTVELLQAWESYPLKLDVIAFNSPQQGFEVQKVICRALRVLLSKEDVGKVVLKHYKEIKTDEARIFAKTSSLATINDYWMLKILLAQPEIASRISDLDDKKFLERELNYVKGLQKTTETSLNIITPRGTAVPNIIRSDGADDPWQPWVFDVAGTDQYFRDTYPQATIVSSSTRTYNCHSYAWANGYTNRCWINSPSDDLYFQEPAGDGSYDNISESFAIKVSYSGDHSATTTSTPNVYISKWGAAPLMQHNKNYVPSIYNSPSYFWRRSVDVPQDQSTITSALSAAVSGQTVNVSGSQGLSNNVSVPSSITLTIKSGANVVGGGYYIQKNTGATLNIEAPAAYLLSNGNRYYGVFPSIQSALSYASSGQTVIVLPGSYTMSSNSTVASGVSLSIPPATSVAFQPGISLTVNGTFTAQGTSSQHSTFDRSGTSGTWSGISFNSGSSGSLNYCDIKNAGIGVGCNGYLPSIGNCIISNNGFGLDVEGIGTSSNRITNNTIIGNLAIGIYIDGSVFICNNNTISNNGFNGILCSNSSSNYLNLNPILYNNKITGHTIGLYCYFSSPWLSNKPISACCPGRGYNVIRENGTGILAAYNSNVFLGVREYGGYNCLHNNTGFEIDATGCTISAEKTWWNKPAPYTPNPSTDFCLISSTVDYDPPFTTGDPNGCLPLPKVSSDGNNIASIDLNSGPLLKASSNGNSNIAVNQESVLDEELTEALLIELQDKFEEVIPVYKQIFTREQNTYKGRYALIKMKECLLKLNRKNDFDDYLNKSVKAGRTAKDELGALIVEFDNQTLFENHNYDAVMKNLKTILKDYKNNEAIYKHTLFDIGFLYLNDLKDVSNAKKYFSQLETDYPNDPLVIHAKCLLLKNEGFPAHMNLSDGLSKDEKSIESTETLTPTENTLLGNYPNPFNPITAISYQLKANSHVTLKAYDMLGREVAILVDGVKGAGYYTANFDGSKLSSGVYFIRFIVKLLDSSPNGASKPSVQVRKMILTK